MRPPLISQRTSVATMPASMAIPTMSEGAPYEGRARSAFVADARRDVPKPGQVKGDDVARGVRPVVKPPIDTWARTMARSDETSGMASTRFEEGFALCVSTRSARARRAIRTLELKKPVVRGRQARDRQRMRPIRHSRRHRPRLPRHREHTNQTGHSSVATMPASMAIPTMSDAPTITAAPNPVGLIVPRRWHDCTRE